MPKCLTAASEWLQTIDAAIALAAAAAAALAFYWGRSWLAARLHWRFSGAARTQRQLTAGWSSSLRNLADLCGDRVALHAISFAGMPPLQRVEREGAPDLSWLDDAKVKADRLSILPSVASHNGSHALCVDSTFRSPGLPLVHFVVTDYSMVLAGRLNGHKPPIISANAIVFCPARKEVLLQLREGPGPFPAAYHVLGGGYKPATGRERGDDVGVAPLLEAALREAWEEAGLPKRDAGRCLVFTGEELDTGFIRFTYAGLAIRPEDRAAIKSSAEGSVAWVSFEELVRFAKTGLIHGKPAKIVPSGACDLMMWLSMGGPDQYRRRPLKNEALKAYRAMRVQIGERLAGDPFVNSTV